MADGIKRDLPAQRGPDGRLYWESCTTRPDNSVARCTVEPDRVIPVIFVPGVMGSNLRQRGVRENQEAVLWRLDDREAFAQQWYSRDAAYRKRYLLPQLMEVDSLGALPTSATPFPVMQQRGWGSVSAVSYGDFLAWLDGALNDHSAAGQGVRERLLNVALGAERGDEPLTQDEINLSRRYAFPVHAFGYNWLQDNAKSSEELLAYIQATIAGHRAQKRRCEKVILVTHSMGGLVARHCSQFRGAAEMIYGVVHGVMPATGAAAVYRRMKAGQEASSGAVTFKERRIDDVARWALGSDGGEMTAVMSSSPGPLQLLPAPEYGDGWLIFEEGKRRQALPKNRDPYNEIYLIRDKWWGLCDGRLINPLDGSAAIAPTAHKLDVQWNSFADLVKERVKPFHDEISGGGYHFMTFAFCGDSRSGMSYGAVRWTGVGLAREDMREYAYPATPEVGQVRTLFRPGAPRTAHAVISVQDEPGDGTVPRRSGLDPLSSSNCRSFLRTSTEHEGAFRDERARLFTLRSIVRIVGRGLGPAMRLT